MSEMTPERIAEMLESAICSAGYALTQEWNSNAVAGARWLRRLKPSALYPSCWRLAPEKEGGEP